ncbi:hypothetical protein JXA32_15885 [Candidatus Sumerlaeota bacterium]|nr:hypothetical protein [Candidatus Sumerlaeota bacterium]
MSSKRRQLPSELVYRACEMLLGRGDGDLPRGATQIARWLQQQGFNVTREQVYPLLQQGIKRGYLRFNPPREFSLSQRLQRRYNLEKANIQVVNVTGPTTHDNIADATAELLLSLIKELGSRRERNEAVHIGFGAGTTTMRIAQYLAQMLSFEAETPPLTLHALSSGFSIHDPTTAPVAFFNYFQDMKQDVSFVGLFAAPVVQFKEYPDVKRLPGIEASFEAAREIDIVVTSLASVNDDHGLLRQFMEYSPDKGMKNLREADWIGDVLWRPYSPDGPIEVDTEIRAVTIFELDELRQLVKKRDKHVIVAAAPCSICGASKGSALKPLLENDKLRIFNHLVTDAATVRELLE